MDPCFTQPARQAYAYPLLVKQLWHAPLANSPDQEIVYRDIQRLTYRQLRGRVGRLASALEGLGVRAGDTVAVMDWDSHRYLECFYAVPMMGVALFTVNIRLSPEQILYTLNHARPRVLVLNAEFLPVYNEIRAKVESVEHVLWISDRNEPAPAQLRAAGEYEALIAAGSPDYVFPDFDENTRATTFYTSGTTGLPKGVFYSHRQLVLHTLVGMAALVSATRGQCLRRDDVYMPITPLFHGHAWGVPYIALQLGLKQVYPGRYLADELFDLIKREGVTFSHCVPTLLHMVLNAAKAAGATLAGWKVLIGGSALSEGLTRLAAELGADVFGGYGMSESGPLLTLAQLRPSTDDTDLKTRRTAGMSLPLVELRTVDPELRDVPADGVSTGEVVVRAPWVTQGYLGRPDASEELWAGGYLHTQDIGYRDRDGYLHITDRVKDVIKSGGEWVSSIEVEDLLSQHPAVSESAVIGVKDDKWGERPLALVVLRAGAKTTDEALKQHLRGFSERGLISRYAVPDRVLLVNALEKTSVGKLDKKVLRQKYA
jgi:fatty-acyl-CoA synthase